MSKICGPINWNVYEYGEILLRQPRITVAIIGNISVIQDGSFKSKYA